VTRSKASLLRLTLLGAIAASHLTLLVRSGVHEYAIMASLSWLAGGVLLLDHEERQAHSGLDGIPILSYLSGLILVAWTLLVLSLSSRLYDPLQHLLPLAGLTGLALLAGLRAGSSTQLQILIIGSLLPLQVAISRHLPTAALAEATARVSSFLLVLLGRIAYPVGQRIVLEDRVFEVDNTCTGVSTITLCLSASVILLLLLPSPFFRQRGRRRSVFLSLACLGIFAAISSFLVNAIRVSVLGLTRQNAEAEGLARLGSFTFWHDGAGSHLFSLLAMLLVCGVYVVCLEMAHQSSSGVSE
jgi:exosortase/archaeosortase family protein